MTVPRPRAEQNNFKFLTFRDYRGWGRQRSTRFEIGTSLVRTIFGYDGRIVHGASKFLYVYYPIGIAGSIAHKERSDPFSLFFLWTIGIRRVCLIATRSY